MAEHPYSTAHTAWVMEWQEKKHALGLCSTCGHRKTPINPKTGLPMWKCDICRAKYNEYQSKRYQRRKA